MSQLSFSDVELSQSRKPSRIRIKLEKINTTVDWDKVLELVRVVGKTKVITGGAPHRNLLTKVKMLFL